MIGLTPGDDRLPIIYRMRLPTRHESHSRDEHADPSITKASELVTPWWDGGFEREDKYLKELRLITENCAVSRPVLVDYQTETDDSDWHRLGSIENNGPQTLRFADSLDADSIPRHAQRIRFRYTLSTTDAGESPRVIMPIFLHTTFRPRRLPSVPVHGAVGAATVAERGHGADQRGGPVREPE